MLSDEIIKAIRGIRKTPKEQIRNPFEIQLVVVNLQDIERNIMASTKFKDGDILVSDSHKIISILKGDYNNGEFRDYACIDSEGININSPGVWDGITDWRLATVKEKAKISTAINNRKQKAERDLAAIIELQKLIQ